MIDIIAIEREYGSGAAAIADKLSKRLNWKLWDRDITCEIARRLKCKVDAVAEREERLDPTFHRLVKVFMRGSYEETFNGRGIELLDAEHLSILFERVIKDVAARGNCVIVGRGAPYFLRDLPNLMRVFLYAPHEEKMRRLREIGKSAEDAEHLLETVDEERAAFVKKYYASEWPKRALYDVMINTRIGDEAVIDGILHHMEVLSAQPVR